jgi:protein tyrosine phosphatase (PTP) superfamily phosphohydrolase (DUF442 family)
VPRFPVSSILALLGSLVTSACIHTPAVTPRPLSWAAPLEAEGLPNLHRVSPDLYRCARPGSTGYASARALGIRTVIDLRDGAEQKPREETAGLEVVHIPVETHEPTYDEARAFFDVVDKAEGTPVLLHCYHGADRTGAFTALYRINREGWDPEDAIGEMTGGDFHFHTIWLDLVDWVREAPEFPRNNTGG